MKKLILFIMLILTLSLYAQVKRYAPVSTRADVMEAIADSVITDTLRFTHLNWTQDYPLTATGEQRPADAQYSFAPSANTDLSCTGWRFGSTTSSDYDFTHPAASIQGAELSASAYGTGTVTTLIGGSITAYSGSGNTTQIRTLNIASSNWGPGTVGSLYNVYIDRNWGGGTITNQYGIYITNHLSGTDLNYNIYAAGNYPSWFSGNVNAMGYNYAADGGSTDAYTITLKGAHTLSAGLEVTFKANTANTGAATLQVNSLTATALTKATASGVNTALATGDIVAGQIVKAVYDGTQFQIISRLAQ